MGEALIVRRGGAVPYTELPSYLFYLSQSSSYGTTIEGIGHDENYIYMGGGSPYKLWKINPSNMSKVAESAAFGTGAGSEVRAIISDGTYLYVAAKTSVWKLNPTDMSTISSLSMGGSVLDLAHDGTYLYACGTNGTVWKIDTSDMSKVAESAAYGGALFALAYDGTYLYTGGNITFKVWKIDTSDMSKVAETLSYSNIIKSLTCDGAYVYVGDRKKIRKVDPSDMSLVAESVVYGSTAGDSVDALVYDGTYLYAGGGYGIDGMIWKLNPKTMSKLAEISYGGTIYSLDFDGTYLYVGGATIYRVWKIASTAYVKEG